MPEHDSRSATSAKRTLAHYLALLASRTGKPLDSDCVAEIHGIVDDVIDAAVDAAVEAVRQANHEDASR
jgi:hypothetical protein